MRYVARVFLLQVLLVVASLVVVKGVRAQSCSGGAIAPAGDWGCIDGGPICDEEGVGPCCDRSIPDNWFCVGSSSPNPACAGHTTQLSCEADSADSEPFGDPI